MYPQQQSSTSLQQQSVLRQSSSAQQRIHVQHQQSPSDAEQGTNRRKGRRRSSSEEEDVFTFKDMNNVLRRLFAEFFGTFILVWAHAGLALSLSNTAVEAANETNENTNVAADAVAAGFTLAGLVYGLGHVSGAHFNPSISLAFAIRGDMNPIMLLPYILIQVGGAFAAAGILDAVFINDEAHGYLGANHPSAGFTVLSAFWMEFIATLFLHMAVIGTATRGQNIGGHAALAAGTTIGALIGFLAPYGGGSMNPARSLGPGMLASNSDIRALTWIYVSAPMAASIFSGMVLKWLHPPSSHQQQKEEDDLAMGTLGGKGENRKQQNHHLEEV